MTALKKYQRLEATGLWRPDPEAQRREVVVSFGEASIAFRDPRSDMALSHWSLAAVVRCNPGEHPALFAPGADEETESLELNDPDMIAAIGAVQSAIAARKPHPWRLRLAMVAMTTSLIAGAIWWGVPGALYGSTARALPFATRVELGRAGLRAMEPYTGRPCATPEGTEALRKLSTRLHAAGGMQLVVMRDGVNGALRLPGRLIVIDRKLIEKQTTPDALAGHVLAALLRDTPDPAVEMLEQAGIVATLRLLTTGEIPEAALDDYARTKLRTPLAPVNDSAAIDLFTRAGVASTPYALTVDPTGRSTRTLIEADPMSSATASAPAILTGTDWANLQDICAP